MGKGAQGKSSASAGTRKKHAKKHAPPPEEPMPKTKKGKKERGKKEPKQKIYIPPVKPAPVQPDPLETTGLAHTLPPGLLIVLRSFSKKAEVTKIRALEELQTGWVEKCLKGGGEDDVLQYTLVEMLPVWLHHVSALFLHSSRRVRTLTASIHLALLRIAPVRERVFFFLHETASSSQVESLLGSWCCAAHDMDKGVAAIAMRSWNDALPSEERFQAALFEFVQRTVLDPAGIYAYLNPVQPSIALSQPQSRRGSGRSTPVVQPRKETPEQLLRTKLEESESENDQDRKARLRFGALGAIKWILESVTVVPESLLALFGNPAFLTSLQPKQSLPWIDLEPFGYGQTTVRKNMWALLQTVLSTKKGSLGPVATQLSRAILRSAFIETDSNVQASMWYPLLLFLKEFPNSWELEVNPNREDEDEDEDDEDNDEEEDDKPKAPTSSGAYQEFLQFLQLGCSGSPIQGYPTVVVILSTLSFPIIASSSSTPLDDLFSSFWAALDGRALSSLNRTALCAAFLSSLLESMVLVLKRIKNSSSPPPILAKLTNTDEAQINVQSFSEELVRQQFGKMWQEIVDGKLKIFERVLAKSIVKTLGSLGEIEAPLSEAAWATLSSSIFSSAPTRSKLVSVLVKELRDAVRSSPEWTAKLQTILAQLAETALDGYAARVLEPATTTVVGVEDEESKLLTHLLDAFKHDLFSVSQMFRERVDGLISSHAYELLRSSPAVFLSILVYRGPSRSAAASPSKEVSEGIEVCRAAWKSILSRLAAQGDEDGGNEERERLLKILVDAAQGGRLPAYLKIYGSDSEEGALDELVEKAVGEITSGGEGIQVQILRGLLVHNECFISPSTFFNAFKALCIALRREIRDAFKDPFFNSEADSRDGSIPWALLESLFSLVLSTFQTIIATGHHLAEAEESILLGGLASDAFLCAYLLPLCEGIQAEGVQHQSFQLAGELWKKWYQHALNKDGETGKSKASKGLKEVRERLTGLILGTKTRVTPRTVLTLLFNTSSIPGTPSFFEAHPEFRTDTVMEFMPLISDLDDLLAELMPALDTTPSMGVLDWLIPPPTGYPYSVSLKISSSSSSMSSSSSLVSSEGTTSTTSTTAMTSGRPSPTGFYGDLDTKGYDRHGYSAYARGVSAIVTVFARDRASAKAKDGVEMLRHLGVVEVCAWDGICTPAALSTSASGSGIGKAGVFGEGVVVGMDAGRGAVAQSGVGVGGEEGEEEEAPSLAGLITKIEQVTTYVLIAGGSGEPWKRFVLDSLSSTAKTPASTPGGGDLGLGGVWKTVHALMNPLSSFVLDMVGRAVQSEMDLKAAAAVGGTGVSKGKARALKNAVVLNSRMLRRMLDSVFDESESVMAMEEVEKWVVYARKVERSAPLVSMTILEAIAAVGIDSPRLDRLRNEYAATLLGVPSSKANKEGLELLRVLGGCVPSEDVDFDESGGGSGVGGAFDETKVTTTTTTTGVLTMKGRTTGAGRRGGGGSDVIFLPVQRAVNLVRGCQRWVEGREKATGSGEGGDSEDEDEEGPSEDLESAMLAVFIGLLPILQGVPGKHWEFMWDVLETVLENSALEDETTLVGLSRALRFVRVMEDLVRTNKPLKAEWAKRRVGVLGNVRDLLLDEESEEVQVKSNSMPRSACRELVLSIVQSLPGELIDQDTLGKMCHLVTDSSIEVQKMGYGMLKSAAEKRTEWVVIEVGVGSMGNVDGDGEPTLDPEAPVLTGEEEDSEPISAPVPVVQEPPVEEKKVGRRKDGRRRKKRKQEEEKNEGPSLLPKELIAIIERGEGDLFGWMLGWMLVFDLFNDVSFKVKSMYIEQLRNLDLVALRLLPSIIHLLRLDEGLNRAVKVETWAVDEFYIPYYEPVSAPVLAAHLYYRALISVPSLIHAWVLACKDRQLSNAFTSFTSTHFSPLIIRAEIAHLKSAEGMAELAGEGMSVKVMGGSEVVAAYAVDDHQLEIRLKIPPDWPLHRIEVRDEKRVGVDENRWRAWVLAVQQTIWTHNGRIVDGLSLFKKNVTLHFEGQVECAICYSVISVSDGSLPKKPCRTCQNRFHAGCLYKWFNTSHSSSCPLCRSNII